MPFHCYRNVMIPSRGKDLRREKRAKEKVRSHKASMTSGIINNFSETTISLKRVLNVKQHVCRTDLP